MLLIDEVGYGQWAHISGGVDFHRFVWLRQRRGISQSKPPAGISMINFPAAASSFLS
jgi:hypothetical protein